MERARAFYEHVLSLHRAHYRDEWVEYDLGDSTFAITTTEMGHNDPQASCGSLHNLFDHLTPKDS